MTGSAPGSWNISPREAVGVQRQLSRRVRLRPLSGRIRRVAGADVSYDPISQTFFAAVVALSWPGLELLAVGRSQGRVTFPYVPGLLSFREVRPLVEAYRNLALKPDLIFCDGQGLAHPRRFGLACHLGVLLNRPTLGCAKTLLVGEHPPLSPGRGSRVPLRIGKCRVGTVIRTRAGVKPVFVSPGHSITVGEAGDWVLRCSPRFRIPEPIRHAHNQATTFRRKGVVGA